MSAGKISCRELLEVGQAKGGRVPSKLFEKENGDKDNLICMGEKSRE